MKIIQAGDEFVEKTIFKNDVQSDSTYRPFRYLYPYSGPRGNCIKNLLNGIIIHLSDEEMNLFANIAKHGIQGTMLLNSSLIT